METQSEMYSPIPANTFIIPRTKPRIKPRIIFLEAPFFISYFANISQLKHLTIASTMGTARGTHKDRVFLFL